ncbi:hypothetical protein ASD16_14085 [Cellulomonas sp. Root485]|nr:hypothetical protein ASD16_14085 [Cellulomonas sp. Root485]
MALSPGEMAYIWVAFLAIFGPIVLGDVLIRRRRAARGRRLRAWADERGWRFDQADGELTAFVTSLLDGQRPARHRLLVRDLLVRDDGDLAVYSFTYMWQWTDDRLRTAVRSRGERFGAHTAHVVAVPLGRIVPRVQVTPEGPPTGLARALGGQDIQLESAEFNRAFRILADDPRAAHAVLHPRLMQRLLDEPGRSASWRIDHGWVFAWVDGGTKVEQILPMLDVVTAVRASLPTFVGTRPVA